MPVLKLKIGEFARGKYLNEYLSILHTLEVFFSRVFLLFRHFKKLDPTFFFKHRALIAYIPTYISRITKMIKSHFEWRLLSFSIKCLLSAEY